MRIREDQVTRPDGEPGIYAFVDTRAAVAAVALTPENDIYMVGQYRYPLEQYSWEIIEGGSEEDETPLECIQRELKEEAGLVAGKWTQLGGEIHMSNCISSERAYIFLAEELTKTESDPDPTEILQVRKMPFDQALQMAATGEIQDAFSILGLFRASEYLKTRQI